MKSTLKAKILYSLNMPYSIQVHFDEITNAKIREMWKKIADQNIPCRAFEKNFSPHLTLVYGEITGDKKVSWDFLTAQKTFEISFEGINVFEDRGVIFLSPEKSTSLANLHKIHDINVTFSSMNKLYRIDNWEPHCSLASRLSPRQVEACVSMFEDLEFPFQATCVSSNFVKYPEAEVLSAVEYKAG